MRRTILAAALAAATAGQALAGGLNQPALEQPVAAPPPAPLPAPASGTDWTGLYAGAQFGYGFGDLDDGTATDLDGILGGVQLGFNYDLGTWVLGGEVDYNFADLAFDGTSGSVDSIARLKGRVGYDLGRALVYATAGGAYASADPGGADLDDFGWALGGGIDYLVGPNIIAGVEYLYHRFDDFDGSGADVQVSTIAAKLSYRF